MLVDVGLAMSLVLASTTQTIEAERNERQYQKLVSCRATASLVGVEDKRSKRALAKIEEQLTKAAQDKPRKQIDADVGAKRAEQENDRYASSSWKGCLRTFAAREVKVDRALSNNLSDQAPAADRIAAAKTIAAAPEKYSSLLLMMAGPVLLQMGDADEGRFLFHAGALRANNFMQFIDQHDDQDAVQIFAITRRYSGLPFAADSMANAHEARLAAERVVAWDRTAPNAELTGVAQDSDPAEAEKKVEAQRCNYLASYYFGEATAALVLKKHYGGDEKKYKAEVMADVLRQSMPALDAKRGEGAVARFGAQQNELVKDAKEAIFDGGEDAYAAKKKDDPGAACALLLTEAKKLVQ